MDVTRRAVKTDMKDRRDNELLVNMSLRDQDPAAAKEAWAEFYRRFVGYLYNVCRKCCNQILQHEASSGRNEELASDLVVATLQKVYERAETFNSGEITDREQVRRRIKAWLGRIAHNELISWLRRKPEIELREVLESYEDVPPLDDRVSPERQCVREAIEALNEKERTVVLFYMQYYNPSQAHQRVPNHAASELAAVLGTTTANLRQIKRRAFKKINTFILSRFPLA